MERSQRGPLTQEQIAAHDLETNEHNDRLLRLLDIISKEKPKRRKAPPSAPPTDSSSRSSAIY